MCMVGALRKNCISEYWDNKWNNKMKFSPAQSHAADSSAHAASIRVKKHKNHSTKAIQARVTSFVCTSREEGRCTLRDSRLEGTGWWVLHSVCCNNCVSKNRLRPQMCLSLGFWNCVLLLLLLESMCYCAWKNNGLMKREKSEESLQMFEFMIALGQLFLYLFSLWSCLRLWC